MTRRASRASMNTIYPRGSPVTCTHSPDAHVVYDRLAAGYRGQVRCGCGQVTVTSPRLRDTVAEATADAGAILRRQTEG